MVKYNAFIIIKEGGNMDTSEKIRTVLCASLYGLENVEYVDTYLSRELKPRPLSDHSRVNYPNWKKLNGWFDDKTIIPLYAFSDPHKFTFWFENLPFFSQFNIKIKKLESQKK